MCFLNVEINGKKESVSPQGQKAKTVAGRTLGAARAVRGTIGEKKGLIPGRVIKILGLITL